MHSQFQMRTFANSSFAVMGAFISLVGLGVAGVAERACGQNSVLSLATGRSKAEKSSKRTSKEKEPKLEKLLVYVGTYTTGKSKGIYLYEMNAKTGALTLKSV